VALKDLCLTQRSSLGLALMQSSANGKTINQGILDNFVKSAKYISRI
jgi:hypothetical protein